MKYRLFFERLLIVLSAVVLAGTNKCQEDYFFAVESRVSIPTGTTTPSGSSTATPVATATPTSTEVADSTPTVAATATPGDGDTTPEPTPTTGALARISVLQNAAGLTPIPADQSASLLFGELASLDNPAFRPSPAVPQHEASADPATDSGNMNWLGNIYSEETSDQEQAKSWNKDTDRDGFVDAFEEIFKTNPEDSRSFPVNTVHTDLAARLRGSDSDADGLNNQAEANQGTDLTSPDSDGDGVSDGAEFLSGSNPLSEDSWPADSDGDGLSDDYERAEGLGVFSRDSDSDGLNDALELAIGSNPVLKDSDLDGVLDSREYTNGGDPAVSDFPRQKGGTSLR